MPRALGGSTSPREPQGAQEEQQLGQSPAGMAGGAGTEGLRGTARCSAHAGSSALGSGTASTLLKLCSGLLSWECCSLYSSAEHMVRSCEHKEMLN